MEPDSGFSTLQLSIERSGSFGRAEIIWSITADSVSFIPTTDVLITSGTIIITNGQLHIIEKCLHMLYLS